MIEDAHLNVSCRRGEREAATSHETRSGARGTYSFTATATATATSTAKATRTAAQRAIFDSMLQL